MNWEKMNPNRFGSLGAGCIRQCGRLLFFLLLIQACLPFSAFSNPSAEPKDLVFLDKKTGLMWQKSDSFHDLKKGINWYEALEYIDRINNEKLGGHDDWRLPTMEELNGLWNPARPLISKDGEPLGLPGGFRAGGSYYLWSGDERGLDNAWYFGQGQKENYFNLKDLADLEQGARLVRNGNPPEKSKK